MGALAWKDFKICSQRAKEGSIQHIGFNTRKRDINEQSAVTSTMLRWVLWLHLATCILLLWMDFHHSVKWHSGEAVTPPPTGWSAGIGRFEQRCPQTHSSGERGKECCSNWGASFKTSTRKKKPSLDQHRVFLCKDPQPPRASGEFEAPDTLSETQPEKQMGLSLSGFFF